ncbi:crocetin glucosyltransferase, chloroplastic-like [Silene latifolia]|uniref:crocetin glucosyltransferase, chloroplastic-like n=1 Tax=Silene latifolia TaxID=37657 RepID=UPI003D77C195
MEGKQKPHFLLVTFPAQGHINPALQFAKRLLRAGTHVTISTSISGKRCLDKANVPDGLEFAPFSDGYDDGFQPSDGDVITYMSKFKQTGSNSLGQVFERSRGEGKQVTCCVYTLLLPWAAEVARVNHVPSALLWIQPASVFDVYYYYFRGYGDVIKECENNPSWSLELPNLPFTLKARDLPSFLLPSTPLPYNFALPTFLAQIMELEKEDTPTILVNTFDELEVDALKAIKRFTLIPVGPLLPSSFLNEKEKDYMRWLDSQNESSVVYVSFGSMSVLSGPQQEELARALITTHRPFLWVIREKDNKGKEEKQNKNIDEGDRLSCMNDLKHQGMIVPWCSQVDVLSHPSVGCFVTHCGWNSTLESITSGIPMVAFPQWTDQTTNAKLVEDVWRIGVRVQISEEEGLVKEEEIKRCLELVMESQEMKLNAKKWKELAVQASKDGGGSHMNLKCFIEDVASLQHTTSP